jgi:hypothetical protein
MNSADQLASQGEAWFAPRTVNDPEEAAQEYPQVSYNPARYYDQIAGRFLNPLEHCQK